MSSGGRCRKQKRALSPSSAEEKKDRFSATRVTRPLHLKEEEGIYFYLQGQEEGRKTMIELSRFQKET